MNLYYRLLSKYLIDFLSNKIFILVHTNYIHRVKGIWKQETKVRVVWVVLGEFRNNLG